MASRFEDAIAELVRDIEAKEKEVVAIKKTVNLLRSQDGLPPIYTEKELAENVARGVAIEPGQFYTKPPTTAAREYLEARGKAALPDEIAAALERGSFDFGAQGWSKGNWARNLAISMSKNSGIFHRLPGGYYGLAKWYDLKKPRVAPLPGSPQAEAPGAQDEEEEKEKAVSSDTDGPQE